MKRTIIPLFAFAFIFASASAAVPLRWTVETSRAVPAQFEAYQGETLALEAALMSYGKPLEAPDSYSLYWQTNGMGNAWWEQKVEDEGEVEQRNSNNSTVGLRASTSTNVLFATWSPTNDVGAKVYNCFIGQPGTIYHAAFQLRLRPSPGATPNELPLPQKVIDFAKVTVLNPPWSGGGGGGVDTNAVIDIIHRTVDGSARPLPAYLHAIDFDDSYPEAAAEWYSGERASRPFSCSAVRSGGFLYRNFDYPFDDRADFVVRVSAASERFASVGVAQVGTNLTEQIVTSGKWSKWYKALPGATVDGINENGVVAEINVVDGEPAWSGGASPALHPLAAVRWILDNATNALQAATYIASHIAFPPGWTQNFHYMIADERDVFIVENGQIEISIPGERKVLTNFNIVRYPRAGMGLERFNLLASGASITNVWYTNAYRRETNPPWVSDLADVLAYTNDIYNAWASHPKEYFRNRTNGGEPWWQTVHTSVYDITNRVLRISVQETDDWYAFSIPGGTGVSPVQVRAIAAEVVAPVASSVSSLEFSKLDKTEAGAKYVQYRGASEDVDLGEHEISAETVNATRVQANAVEAYNIECIGGKITATRIESSLGLTVYGNFGPEIAQDGFYTTGQDVYYTAGKRSYDSWEEVTEEGWNRFRRVIGRNDDDEIEYEYLGDVLEGKADNSTVSSLASRVSDLVPYSGATRDVNLGHRKISSSYAESRVSLDPYGFEIANTNGTFSVRYNDLGISSQGASAYGMEDFNLNFPFGKSGDIAVEDPFEIVALIDIASTNAAARAALSAKVMSVIDAAVEAKITTALAAHRIRTYDDVRHCWWVCDVVNGVPTWTVEE